MKNAPIDAVALGVPVIEKNTLAAFQLLSTGVLLVEDTGVYYANAAAEALLGASLATLRGQSLEQIFGSSSELTLGLTRIWQGSELPVRLVLHAPERQRNFISALACDLSLWERTNARPYLLVELHEPHGNLRSVREEASDVWQEASMALVRNLAHEIRNPLGGMRGASQLLHDLLPTHEMQEYTQVILTEIDRLHRLMDQFLIPRQADAMRLNNIHHLCEQVLRLVRQEYPEIALQRDYDPSLPEVEADGDMLVQCLLNIVRNAAQAAKREGCIVVRTRASPRVTLGKKSYPHALMVQVEDNGPGIDEAILDKIFHPLFSLQPGGTGLGLAVARQVVSLHGGSVNAESKKGRTCFTILLPFRRPPASTTMNAPV